MERGTLLLEITILAKVEKTISKETIILELGKVILSSGVKIKDKELKIQS